MPLPTSLYLSQKKKMRGRVTAASLVNKSISNVENVTKKHGQVVSTGHKMRVRSLRQITMRSNDKTKTAV